MKPSNTLRLLGCSLVLTAFGCEVQESLGDLPADESTLSGGGGEAGMGTEPTGGSQASGGTVASGGGGAGSGVAGGTGGAAPEAGNGGAPVTPEAGAPNLAGSGGTSAPGGGGQGGGCNSPDGSPPVVSEDAPGCPCTENEPDACVYDRSQLPYRQVAFTCYEGNWMMVEDGACYPRGDGGPKCVVENRIYWSGDDTQGVPDPFSCNTCACENGNVVTCTEIGCFEECPLMTAPGQSCLECGDTDACLAVETGCFPTCSDNDDCDGSRCVNGICVNLCP